jgi:PAS domain S-box-containing protein
LKENLQNIINSTTDIIISFDKDNKVSTWNKQAEYITGFKQKKVIGKHISELKVFDNPRELLDGIQSIYEGKRPESDKLVLKTINHVKKIIKTSFSIVKGGNKQSIGSLLTGKDITNEIESHGKLLQGNSYLISDKNIKSALYLFIILTSPDCKGLWITRSNPEILKSTVSSRNIQTIVLKQNTAREFEHISDLERLTAKIKDFTEKNIKSVILLDRIDYLLSNFSFEQFIKSLYQITDIISENNSILLLHLNPSVVDARQLAMVEGELRPLPGQKLEDIQIRDNYYDILKLVYEHNQNNSFISFKKISQSLSVNNKTIGKRIHDLEEKGLILIRKQGNLKTSFVSEKGKALLHKRNIL